MTYKFFRLIIFTFLLNSCATQTKYKVCLNDLIERIDERKKLSHSDTYMTSTAIQYGLGAEKIGIFKDSGYRGMYNKSLADLKEYKGLHSAKNINLYDFMGISEELANSFRTIQTAARIKTRNLHDEKDIIKAANDVGREVREMMIMNTGQKPENLSIETNINHFVLCFAPLK